MTAPSYPRAYVEEDGWVTQRYQLASGNVLRVAGKDLRRERTGIHGAVSISINWVTLAWSNFNVERDEDRVRLANSAWTQVEANEAYVLDRKEFPKAQIKKALDDFCLGVWAWHVGALTGGMLEGDPDSPPAQLALPPYIVRDGGTILYAPPGMGKSYTALAWAVSLAWGVNAIWPIRHAMMPLYVNVERSPQSMAARLARVNQALGLDPHTPIPFLNARGKSLADIYEAAAKTIAQESATIVLYDSISRAGFGSLVGDDVANKIMDMLNQLCPTWVALAHSPRGDESHAFGSQMFDAAADVTVQLRSQTSLDGTSTGVGLQVIKANDIKKPPMAVHVLEWNEDGLVGMRRGQRGEFAELDAGERRTKEEDARIYLLQAGHATAGQVAEQFGWNRSHTSLLLNAARWTAKEKRGKEVYFAVRSDL